MTDNGCIIKAFIGDNLKRAKVRDALQHNSSFPCEYCFQKASTYNVFGEANAAKISETESQINVIQSRIEKLVREENSDNEELETLIVIKNGL